MNRQSYTVAMFVLVVCLLTTNPMIAYGQGKKGATRIRFKRGESSTTINGQLSHKQLEQYFIIGAKAGQELYVQVKGRNDSVSSPFNFVVIEPSGKYAAVNWDGDTVRMRLRKTADYKIKVGLPRYSEGSTQQFSLFIRID